MRFYESWKGWRQYRKLGPEWKKIVFYSESGQDWHYFEPLIRALLDRHDEKVTYVTSDATDPGLGFSHAAYTPVCIPEGLFLIIHFQTQKAGVLVLTMMDLGNLQLKKSIHPVHYVYIFHSMGSTHMVDHANSYDAYDSFFCVGPHHVAELRKREAMEGLAPRNMIEYGHPRLEQLVREAQSREHSPAAAAVVLIAPTWGDDSIFNRCGETLIGTLLEAGFRVIMRPHYHTLRLTPDVIDHLVNKYGGHEQFELIEQMGETDSLYRSDLLICDWSAIAIEYSLGLEKPVLFIDLPRRIRNPEWRKLGIEPFESAIREQVGIIVPADGLDKLPDAVRRLTADPAGFRAGMAELRDRVVFNPGSSVSRGAAEIARLAAEYSRKVAAPL